MKKRIIKYFYNALTAQEKWLNKMACNGYRLIGTDNISFSFEQCNPDEYVYKVQFVADKTLDELKDYCSFMESLGYRTFNKPLAFGRYASSAVTIRPFAKGKAMIATSPGMINKELLIIEKANDKKPFEIITDNDGKIKYTQLLLRYQIWGVIYMLLMGIVFFIDFKSMALKSGLGIGSGLLGVALLTLFLMFTVNVIRYLLQVKRLRNLQKTYE